MSIVRKIRRTLRGDVAPTAAARELLRRSRVRLDRRRERARLGKLQARAARLHPELATMTGAELLDHFRTRSQPAAAFIKDQLAGIVWSTMLHLVAHARDQLALNIAARCSVFPDSADSTHD